MKKGYSFLVNYRRFFAGFLGLLFLVISFAFHFETHFCNDKVVDFSCFGNAKSCFELLGEMPPSDIEKQVDEVKNKNCCSQTIYSIDAETTSRVKVFAEHDLPRLALIKPEPTYSSVNNTIVSVNTLWEDVPIFLKRQGQLCFQVFRL